MRIAKLCPAKGRIQRAAAAALTAVAWAGAVGAAPAHQHGVARLDAAAEGAALTLAFSLPMDSLLGFERAPRTAGEKQAATQLVERLRRAADMVQPDPAAQCEISDVTLVSPALGLGGAPVPAGAGAQEHADVDASYTFRCREPGKLGHVDLPLMKAFARLTRIEAQVVGQSKQAMQVIKRPASRLAWPR